MAGKILTFTRNINYESLHERIVEKAEFDDSGGLEGFRSAYDVAKERVDARTNAWFDENLPGTKVG